MATVKKGYARSNPQDLLDVLKGSRDDAVKLSQQVGVERARVLLQEAERDLSYRLLSTDGLGGVASNRTFTQEQMRLTLKTIRESLTTLKGGLKKTLIDQGEQAAEQATDTMFSYLSEAGQAFGGYDEIPNIKTVAVLDNARRGVNSSILRRLAAAPEPNKPGRGILERYGEAVIGKFEQQLQVGLITRKAWKDVRESLITESPFLQDAPLYWAERIVRTETIGAYNRANWEVMRGVDEELGDMCKILCATFDNRTGADSYAVHGQIRKTEEAFDTWQGLIQHPPARPNDREVIVPHRVAWPIPPYLAWKSDGEIAARWRALGNKRPVPPRPEMTTIEIEKFGKQSTR